MLSDSIILKKIQRQPKQTAGYKQLVREFGLHGDERRELTGRLQKLVASRQLVAVDSDRYAIPQAAAGKNMIAGKLSLHRDGFGFVTPDPATVASLKARIAGDIFRKLVPSREPAGLSAPRRESAAAEFPWGTVVRPGKSIYERVFPAASRCL